ncbi:MAG: hypothetical protein HY553_08955 [Elusimicrobia bacterium]|nr:hypothetical protein [Elusimicrobiota bacterium]
MREFDVRHDPLELEAIAGGVASACVSTRLRHPLDRYERASLLRAAEYVDRVLQGKDTEDLRSLSDDPMRDLHALAMAREAAKDVKRLAPSVTNGRFRTEFAALRDLLRNAHKTGRLAGRGVWTPEAIEEYWDAMFWRSAGLVARPTDKVALPEAVTA